MVAVAPYGEMSFMVQLQEIKQDSYVKSCLFCQLRHEGKLSSFFSFADFFMTTMC
jgi:hypothetical protein